MDGDAFHTYLIGFSSHPTPAAQPAMDDVDLDVIENAHMIHSDKGSKPEPPLDQSWSDLIKLKWHAALVRSETDINVTVHQQPQNYPGSFYQITLTGPNWSSCSIHTYRDAWRYLNGIQDGAKAVLDKAGIERSRRH
jgi:hypothetical protein